MCIEFKMTNEWMMCAVVINCTTKIDLRNCIMIYNSVFIKLILNVPGLNF